jgi:hypothetical protein
MTRIGQLAVLAAAWVLASQSAPAQQAESEPKAVVPSPATDPMGRDDNWTKWLDLPPIAPHLDWYTRPVETDFGKNGNGLKSPRASAQGSGSTEPADRFAFGSNYFGIETQKGLQDPFRQRKDCANDDECAEFSGLPKSGGQAKKSFKNFKPPFIGLSVTRPIE